MDNLTLETDVGFLSTDTKIIFFTKGFFLLDLLLNSSARLTSYLNLHKKGKKRGNSLQNEQVHDSLSQTNS